MDITINNMNLEDLNLLKDSLLIDFDDFWSFEILKNDFLNTNSTYIIAKINDIIVGFGGILELYDVIHITNIVVNKNYRHLGIGSLILENLIKISKDKNFDCITLEVNQNNINAQNLYKKYNFELVGKRKKYYNLKDDAIIMSLFLK